MRRNVLIMCSRDESRWVCQKGRCGRALAKSRATSGKTPVDRLSASPSVSLMTARILTFSISIRGLTTSVPVPDPVRICCCRIRSQTPPWLSTTHDRSENHPELISERTLRFDHSLTRVSVWPSSSRHEFATHGVSLVRSAFAFFGKILAR